MSRSVLSLCLAGLFAIGCDSAPTEPPSPAAPLLARDGQPRDGQPAHDHYKAPFSQTVMNSCPLVPEPVLVEGVLIYNSHFKFFDGGNSNRLMSNIHGSGIGTITGVKYQYHELTTIRGRYTYANSRLEAEHRSRMHLISQGSVQQNFFLTIVAKQVCSTEGCTFEVVRMETDCRG